MSQHKHLYNMAAWRRLRVAQLSAEPLCRMCRELGRLTEARVADHVRPHRGDVDLFLDSDNLQSLCKPCHDGHKQAQENSADGILRGARQDGQPLDLSHPFYRPARPQIGPAARSDLQTTARASALAIAANSASAAPARGLDAGQGGWKSRGVEGPKTAVVPSFATCQNSQGGV